MTDLFQQRGDNISSMMTHAYSQGLSFYSDIAQYIAARLSNSTTASLLDIGSRTGIGPGILRAMYHPKSYSSLKLDPVTAIDIDPTFQARAAREFPDIECLTGDAFEFKGKRSWDIVMSSHTIEHVDDAPAFLRSMQSICTKMAIVACPFEEENLIEWHKNRITFNMLSEAGYHDMHIYRSTHWFNSMCVVASWKNF